MTNPDQNARPKLSRREFLKTAGAVGGSLVVSGLVEACSKAITQAPTAIPIVRPTDTLTNSPFPSPTATIAATETPKPPETPIPPKPVTITTNLLTSGLTGIGGGNEEAPIPIPTSTSGGGTQKEVPFIDTYGYTQNAWLWDDKSKATDISKDPIKALQYFIALTEMSVVEGGIDFQKLFPKLASPLVFEKMTVNTLPGGNTISAKINAQPQGLEINKMTHMIVVGRYTDRSAGNQVIIAFDDFNRSKIASPRLTLAVLPETIDPSTSAVTSFQDMLKQNGWDYDWAKGVITLPKGKQLLINQIDNVTGQSFADQISDAAGALYVNKRPDGGIYFNPVVPYPTKVLRDKAVSGYAIQNSQPVGLDLNNKPVAQASYDAGSDTWSWKEVKKEPQTLREAASRDGIGFGFFIDPAKPGEAGSKDLLAREANLVAPGAFAFIWLSPNSSVFIDPDRARLPQQWINFAKGNGMRVTAGNSLVYHHDFPDWLKNGHFSVDDYKNIMFKRITDTITAFPQLDQWFVLNEAVWYYQGHNGYENTVPKAATGQDIMNDDFIIACYQKAREAVQNSGNPNILLGYNDFTNLQPGKDSVVTGPKADLVYGLVKKLAGKGLVDKVGLQFHMFSDVMPSTQDIINTVDRYNGLVKVDITELDIPAGPNQAKNYQHVINALMQTKALSSITIWGINNENNNGAVLFSSGQPTDSYNAVLQALKSKSVSS